MRRLRWVSRHLRCPKVSKGRAERPLLAVTHGNFAVKESLAGGTDAPTPARTDGAAAPRRAVLSFDAKESTKESQRHGDYGKKPFIAHFDGGARNVARNGVGQLSPALRARSCSPFSAVKMGGPFSLRCLSPLCSPAAGAGQTQPVPLGMVRRSLDIFAMQKASGISYPRWPFQRAMRPVAEWRSFLLN